MTRSLLLVLAVFLTFTAGCGDSTCPSGSVSRDGKCVPAEEGCIDGILLSDGTCAPEIREPVVDSGQVMVDAGAGQDAALPPDPCEALGCEHGTCVVEADGPVCTCVDGFRGETCDECEDGLGLSEDGDTCVPLCESEEAPSCGDHGECALDDDEARCECERGYEGDECDECAEQFSRDDDDDTCEPDCGDCWDHSFCDTEADVPECVCVRGYAYDGVGCKWYGGGMYGGGLADEEIDMNILWTARHVTIFDGTATFSSATVDGDCELGVLAQTFDMPERDEAEPFVLELQVTTTCDETDPDECPPLQVEIGSSLRRVQVPGGSGLTRHTIPICLGQDAYGDDVSLRVRPGLAKRVLGAQGPAAFDCLNDAWPIIEALRIRAAEESECEPGVPNGELDAEEDWSLSSATIDDGELTLDATGHATAHVVFPSDDELDSSALKVDRLGTPAGTLEVYLDGLLWGYMLSTASDWFFCLPDWARGLGHELRLRAANAEVQVSSITIEEHEECGGGEFDSNFERGEDGDYPGRDGSWSVVPGAGTPARIEEDAARTGSRGVRMTGAAGVLYGLARLPEATASARPAISFSHRVNDDAITGQLGTVTPLGTPAAALVSTSWMSGTVCPDRAWDAQLAGMWLPVGISGGSEGIDLDDISPMLSSGCD
jgi:hypothetical protein